LNTISAVKKQEPIHSLICNLNLDILILTETKILETDSDSIKNGIAPPEYEVLHEPRLGVNRGGGIAIIFRSDLNDWKPKPTEEQHATTTTMTTNNTNNPTLALTPTTFEVLRVEFVINKNLIIHIVAIYRRPKARTTPFYAELCKLLDELKNYHMNV